MMNLEVRVLSQEKSLHGLESARLFLTVKSHILRRESVHNTTVQKCYRADVFTPSGVRIQRVIKWIKDSISR